MSEYVISCCTTTDLNKDIYVKKNIEYVCFHYEVDGVDYLDNFGESMSFDEFYKKMEQGAMTRTSQVNVDEYTTHFAKFLKEGKDVIHFALSSGISGTVNSANIAADVLRDEYPNRKIYIIDSLAASAGFGLFVDAAADKRDEGLDIDELYKWAMEKKDYVNHWFFTSDLTYLIRGGRVSKTAGFVGQMLNICPLLTVNSEGKLIPKTKIRTKKKVIEAVVKKMEELADNGLDYNGKCYISNAACYEDARAVADLIEEKFHKLDGKVEISSIGTTIGAHTGPGTVALFFWGEKRGL